jgi:hypothetical protein
VSHNGLVSNPYQPSSSPEPSEPQAYPASGATESNPYGQQPGAGGYYPGATTQPYNWGYGAPTENHPRGTLILVLGIAGLLVAGILSPFAWIMGSRALKEIRATGSRPANEQLIVVGRILGIIGTVLLILGVVLFVLLITLATVAFTLQ